MARAGQPPLAPRSVKLPVDLEGGPGDDVMTSTGSGTATSCPAATATTSSTSTSASTEGTSALADLSAGLLVQGRKRARIELFETYYLNAFVPLTLHGSDGPDQIRYAAPGLTADLGDGDDVLSLGRDDASDDTVDGGPGTDTVDVGAGNDTCTNVEAGPC